MSSQNVFPLEGSRRNETILTCSAVLQWVRRMQPSMVIKPRAVARHLIGADCHLPQGIRTFVHDLSDDSFAIVVGTRTRLKCKAAYYDSRSGSWRATADDSTELAAPKLAEELLSSG